jgi:hypothetical protein
MDGVSGMLLDVNPSCRLDQMLCDAGLDALLSSRPASKILRPLSWLGLYVSAKRRLMTDARRNVYRIIAGHSKADRWRKRFGKDFAVIEDYLQTVFETVAEVMAVGIADRYATLLAVAGVALDGFLPVDVEGEGPDSRIVVACWEGELGGRS